MRRVADAALLVVASLALGACILNPQPFPPQGIDNWGGGSDASVDGPPPKPSDGGADATSMVPDSGFGTDAGLDGGTDAGLDGGTDANLDAAHDAESDAEGD